MKSLSLPKLPLAIALTAGLTGTVVAQVRVANFYLDETTSGNVIAADPTCSLDTDINSRGVFNQVRLGGLIPCAQHGQMTGNVSLNADPCIIDAIMRFNGGGSVRFNGYPEIDALAPAFTVSFWLNDANPQNFIGDVLLLSGSDGNNSGWAVTLNREPKKGAQELRFGTPMGVCTNAAAIPISFPGATSCGGVNNDNFKHVVLRVTQDAATMTTQVEAIFDGLVSDPTVGTLPVLVTPPGPDSIWQIGGDDLGHTCAISHVGRLVDVNLFDGVINDAAIINLFNNPGASVGSPNLGTNYCVPVPNTTGVAGAMSATGSTSISTNALTLRASQLPVGEFGIFLTSLAPAQTSLPGYNNGGPEIQLCLAQGPLVGVGRYNRPGEVLQVDAAGTVALTLDMSSSGLSYPVIGVPNYAAGPMYFQFWHRESSLGGDQANMSDGLEVILVP